LRLERSLFNIEMMVDAASERVWIVEVNPRICGQFADLYQKVDGTNTYEVALALCTGTTPRIGKGQGVFLAAASFPLRIFEPMMVVEAPTSRDVSSVEVLLPQTLVWSECAAGETLADFGVDEDGGSHRYCVVNVGGSGREDLAERCRTVQNRLRYRMRPLAEAGD